LWTNWIAIRKIEKIKIITIKNIGREKGPRNEEKYARLDINPFNMDISTPIRELNRDRIEERKDERRYSRPFSSSERKVFEMSFPQLSGFR